MRYLLGFLKLLAILLVSLILIPMQHLTLLFAKGKNAYILPQLWHKAASRIFGLQFTVQGKLISDRQVFYVGNHLSHFDIFILGGLIPASFVAKEDLAKWPVVSLLCRLQQTAFISRSSGQASQVQNNIRDMIDQGKTIILFPEGTSTRGETVLDFKSSLFSLPMEYADRGLQIQPFTIKLLDVDHQPAVSQELQDLYAWDRDNPISMGLHIFNFVKLRGGARLQIIFHPPVPIEPGEDRKILARRIQEIVAAPLELKPAAV